MSFMQPMLYQKGRLYCADCAKCGTTSYIHEWTTDAFNEGRDAMQAGTYRCTECGRGNNPETFRDCGCQYAARYSAPGYMDCTDWHYGRNKRLLMRELRDMYGEG